LEKAKLSVDSPEEERARLGHLASWLSWSLVAIFVLLVVLDNVVEVDGVSPLEAYACLGIFVALIVAWAILKALSLPD
jgi:hypothetical protein